MKGSEGRSLRVEHRVEITRKSLALMVVDEENHQNFELSIPLVLNLLGYYSLESGSREVNSS